MQHDIKAVAFDLDGTLLTSAKTISARSIKAIKALTERHIMPVIATGRSMPTSKHFAMQLGVPSPLICYNGACIHDWDHDTDLFHLTMEEQVGLELIRLAHKTTAHFHAFMDHRLFFTTEGRVADFLEPMSSALGEEMDFSTISHPRFTKGMFIGQPEETAPVRDEIERLFPGQLQVVYSHPNYLEVMPKGATKGAALAYLMESFGIGRNETIAFGDGENDLEMLDWAGYGIAMSNAPLSVVSSAGRTRFSNDEDGIARWLEEFFHLEV